MVRMLPIFAKSRWGHHVRRGVDRSPESSFVEHRPVSIEVVGLPSHRAHMRFEMEPSFLTVEDLEQHRPKHQIGCIFGDAWSALDGTDQELRHAVRGPKHVCESVSPQHLVSRPRRRRLPHPSEVDRQPSCSKPPVRIEHGSGTQNPITNMDKAYRATEPRASHHSKSGYRSVIAVDQPRTQCTRRWWPKLRCPADDHLSSLFPLLSYWVR